MMHLIIALVAMASLVVAIPASTSPHDSAKVVRASQFCVYPEEFVVKDLWVWTPDEGNDRSAQVSFDFSDDSTNINTKCKYNETSVNVAAQGAPPRYACDFEHIQFSWQNGNLTLLERACYLEDEDTNFQDAVGWVKPARLDCIPTTKDSPLGVGTSCRAKPAVLTAVFAVLEPVQQ